MINKSESWPIQLMHIYVVGIEKVKK